MEKRVGPPGPKPPRFKLVGIRRTIEGVTPQLPPEPIPARVVVDDPTDAENEAAFAASDASNVTPEPARIISGINSALYLIKGIAWAVACVGLIALTIALAPILFLSIPAGVFAFGCAVRALADFVYAFGHGAVAVSRR